MRDNDSMLTIFFHFQKNLMQPCELMSWVISFTEKIEIEHIALLSTKAYYFGFWNDTTISQLEIHDIISFILVHCKGFLVINIILPEVSIDCEHFIRFTPGLRVRDYEVMVSMIDKNSRLWEMFFEQICDECLRTGDEVFIIMFKIVGRGVSCPHDHIRLYFLLHILCHKFKQSWRSIAMVASILTCF